MEFLSEVFPFLLLPKLDLILFLEEDDEKKGKKSEKNAVSEIIGVADYYFEKRT